VTYYSVGSSAACNVCIQDDSYVSSRHAVVWSTPDGKLWVEDLGSMNGTFIRRNRGGRMVEERVKGPTEVTATDEIRVGRTIIPAKGKPNA